MVQLSHPYMTTGKTIALTRLTFVGKVISLLLTVFNSKVPLGYNVAIRKISLIPNYIPPKESLCLLDRPCHGGGSRVCVCVCVFSCLTLLNLKPHCIQCLAQMCQFLLDGRMSQWDEGQSGVVTLTRL